VGWGIGVELVYEGVGSRLSFDALAWDRAAWGLGLGPGLRLRLGLGPGAGAHLVGAVCLLGVAGRGVGLGVPLGVAGGRHARLVSKEVGNRHGAAGQGEVQVELEGAVVTHLSAGHCKGEGLALGDLQAAGQGGAGYC